MYGVMSTQKTIQVPEVTTRYLYDAACATDTGNIQLRVSNVKFMDNPAAQIHELNQLTEIVKNVDAIRALEIARITIEEN